jgi:DNA polymerase-3 subunit gamma/tau
MALYHRYRPQTLDDVIGNVELVATLRADLTKPDPPHAYLFQGPTGAGKTTLGRIVGRQLGTSDGNFHEVDSADFRGIDTIREIRRQSALTSFNGGAKVWLMDECHKLSNDAMNALLKALEDPPPHVYFVLATTDPQKLLSTIKGRCAQYTVRPLKEPEMLRLLRRAVKGEGKSLERVIYDQIAQDSEGLPRNALQILDQVLAVEPAQRLDVAKRSAERQSATIELCRALLESAGWKKVSVILAGLTMEEPESVRRAVLAYCQAVLLKEDNATAGDVMTEFSKPIYDTGMAGLVLACYAVVKS